MAENTKGQNLENRNERRNPTENLDQDAGRQNASTDREGSAHLDEKSSGLGRRNKNTGIAAKDGTTGSDYDGQVTDR